MIKTISLSVLLFVIVPNVVAQLKSSAGVSLPGYTQFEDSVRKNMKYPEDARRKGIQGTVHVRVLFDADGRIKPETVTVASGLYQSCDSEAVRVVKKFRGKFDVRALPDYNDKVVFIFPIKFALSGIVTEFVHAPHKIERPFKAIIAKKGYSKGDPNWAVYPTSAMNVQFKSVPPGDSVEITGWGPWCLFMENSFVSGYIGYRALESTPQVDSLVKIIEAKSPEEEIPETESANLDIIGVDTTNITHLPTARFSATASKKSIVAGECVLFTLSFDVDLNNRLPLQFYDLTPQFMKMWPHLKKGSYTLFDDIRNVEGVERTGSTGLHNEYAISRTIYCPSTPTTISLPQFTLKMIVGDTVKRRGLSFRSRTGKLKKFVSSPVTIRVNPLPEGLALSSFGAGKMVGHYKMTEETSTPQPSVNEKFQYSVTITGNHPLHRLQPPVLSSDGVEFQLADVVDEHTFDTTFFKATRKFIYQCIARREGTIDLSGKIDYRFYDPSQSKVVRIRSSTKIIVSGAQPAADTLKRSESFFAHKLFILIDVSQSMLIEDYKPNRLEVVKEGIIKFQQRTGMCDVGIILFSGKVKRFRPAGQDPCYSSSRIGEIEWDKVNSGTAIGDGISHATMSIANGKGKVVVIGDGDNTAGFLTPQDAATTAKEKGVKIYGIGVGSPGLVPFGRDSFGRPNVIDNTFTDRDFQTIARITGGQYAWAKDSDTIADALVKFLRSKEQ